jgi:transcriptional regulator with XRE-family HTH domain
MTVGRKRPAVSINDLFFEEYFESLNVLLNSQKDALRASGLSQDELAVQSGIDKSTISRIMRGKRDITLKTGVRLAAAMHARLIPLVMPNAAIEIASPKTNTEHITRTATALGDTPMVRAKPWRRAPGWASSTGENLFRLCLRSRLVSIPILRTGSILKVSFNRLKCAFRVVHCLTVS